MLVTDALAGVIVEIDYGLFRVLGRNFIRKSLGTFKILIFGHLVLYQTPLTVVSLM